MKAMPKISETICKDNSFLNIKNILNVKMLNTKTRIFQYLEKQDN